MGEAYYEVLTPWAEADPIPLKGISTPLDVIDGKKIGLFAIFKSAAVPILKVLERRLKERFPSCETSIYDSRGVNVIEAETENRAIFEDWIKGLDAVVAAVGD